jgi:hypothetical protein
MDSSGLGVLEDSTWALEALVTGCRIGQDAPAVSSPAISTEPTMGNSGSLLDQKSQHVMAPHAQDVAHFATHTKQ